MTDFDTRVPEFSIALRGYDRVQVDEYIDRLLGLVEEAEERAHLAVTPRESNTQHAQVGPRIAKILELAQAEADDLRESARREAREMVTRAREEAKALIERNQDEWERLLDEYEAERERIRTEVRELSDRRSSVVNELRRLRETLGVASGMGDATFEEERALGTPARELNPADSPRVGAGPADEEPTAMLMPGHLGDAPDAFTEENEEIEP